MSSKKKVTDGGLEIIPYARKNEAAVGWRQPQCPTHLTSEQAEEWRTIVDSFPAGYFARTALPLLEQYCRHIVASRRVADLLKAAEKNEEIDLDQYEKLLKCSDRESRALAFLYRALQLDHMEQTEVFVWED